ncbi:STAS domain-containing protein [Streptomyces sp. NPDC046909]|uniref:STAS domain-containing protein n=1 Tax=Streptomyces sp. NPDC046909 TaxID=3155617 RepID=UPI0033DF471E
MTWSELRGPVRAAVVGVNEHVAVRLAGELDMHALPALVNTLPQVDAYSGRIALDLGRVTFCDSAGASALLAFSRHLSAQGRAVSVERVHSSVLRVLRMTGHIDQLRLERGSAPVLNGLAMRRNGQLLRGVLIEMLRLTGAPMGNAQLYDPDTGVLRIVTQRGFHEPFLTYFETVEDRESACGAAAQDRAPVFVEEVESSGIFLGTPALDVVLDAEVRSVMSLPVASGDGRLLGVVSVHHTAPRLWTPDERESLGRLGAAVREENPGVTPVPLR